MTRIVKVVEGKQIILTEELTRTLQTWQGFVWVYCRTSSVLRRKSDVFKQGFHNVKNIFWIYEIND